jgi:hypothetical protein
MTEPSLSAHDLEDRVCELATGFALGELEESELRELYDLLRDDAGRGPEAARVAWQTLGMVTDLRSEVADSFQDTMRHRIGQDRSGRFRNRLWNRLGFGVKGLEPVEAPAPSRPLSLMAWTVVVTVCTTLVVGVLLAVLMRARPVHATVIHLLGSATCAGRALIPDADVDGHALVVKSGSQLTLRWPDGSHAIIAGGDVGDGSTAAEASVRSEGLSLTRGRAWVTARSGFDLVLPGRSASAVSDDTTVAVEVVDGQSFIGVRHGALRAEGIDALLVDNAGVGPSGGFSWLWEWDATSGALGTTHPAPSDWRLGAEVYWSDPSDNARLTLSSGEREIISLACSPGVLAIVVAGRETQRISVPGSPLLGYRLDLRQKQPRLLAITLADQTASVTLPQATDHYHLSLSAGANFKVTAFYPLPDPRPPMATSGW